MEGSLKGSETSTAQDQAETKPLPSDPKRWHSLLTCRFKPFGNAVIHIAASSLGHVRVVSQLCKAGANPNELNCLWNTPLHFAAFAGNRDIVEELVRVGGNVNAWNIYGQTPLHFATEEALQGRGGRTIPTLLKHGAKIKRDFFGFTPLDLACEKGEETTIDLLLETGDFSEVEGHSCTLERVVDNGDVPMALKLLSCTRDALTRFRLLARLLVRWAITGGDVKALVLQLEPLLRCGGERLFPGGMAALLTAVHPRCQRHGADVARAVHISSCVICLSNFCCCERNSIYTVDSSEADLDSTLEAALQ